VSTATSPRSGERVELGRYRLSSGERVIYGQRLLGVVRLVDHPADGHGRRYVIERELTVMAELEAIVADYLRQAAIWDQIPAAGPCGVIAELEARLSGAPATTLSGSSASRSASRTSRSRRWSAAMSSVVSAARRPCAHDLIAVAGEFGESAVAKLRTVLAVYEALLASEDGAG
jgi:hypothetical protein